ncbi:MAG TPA: EVE domain-containing protein, partial [Ignavibacteriaceae bacterium]|nr:EVE domain-containing protein [Ignavibacteriaceae bacterium]
RNFMRDEMKKGDGVLYYHSNTDPTAVVGYCEVVKEGYPDHTQFDPDDKHFDPKADPAKPTWMMVDIKLVKKFKNPVPLAEIKENPKLQKMRLVQRGNRLSVMPVEKKEWDEILKMGS